MYRSVKCQLCVEIYPDCVLIMNAFVDNEMVLVTTSVATWACAGVDGGLYELFYGYY